MFRQGVFSRNRANKVQAAVNHNLRVQVGPGAGVQVSTTGLNQQECPICMTAMVLNDQVRYHLTANGRAHMQHDGCTPANGNCVFCAGTPVGAAQQITMIAPIA